MINIYIPNSSLYLDFILFSLGMLLLIDKFIHCIFRNSNNLIMLYGSHEKYNTEFSFGLILYIFICSFLLKS